MKTPVQNPMHIERHHPKTLAYIRITGPYGKGYESPSTACTNGQAGTV